MRRTLRDGVLALLVATGTLLFLTYNGSPVLRSLETESLDLRFRLRGTERPGNEIAIVLVDDRSLATLGRWPLSRSLFTKAVEQVDRAGAKVIGARHAILFHDKPSRVEDIPMHELVRRFDQIVYLNAYD